MWMKSEWYSFCLMGWFWDIYKKKKSSARVYKLKKVVRRRQRQVELGWAGLGLRGLWWSCSVLSLARFGQKNHGIQTPVLICQMYGVAWLLARHTYTCPGRLINGIDESPHREEYGKRARSGQRWRREDETGRRRASKGVERQPHVRACVCTCVRAVPCIWACSLTILACLVTPFSTSLIYTICWRRWSGVDGCSRGHETVVYV